MRKTTFASLLILCGSTAAIAQVVTPSAGDPAQNITNNGTAPYEPPAANDTTTPPANDIGANEADPKPM